MKKAFNFMVGALIGGVIGAVTALLYAPSSGKALRLDLQQKAHNIQIEIKEAAQQKREELEKQLNDYTSGEGEIQ
jgi:gas vesicle protein